MKSQAEGGFTGTSIAIAIVIIFIFVSLIAMLLYNYNSGMRDVQLKAKATEIAISEIENIKSMNFSDVEAVDAKEVETGFYKSVILVDYADINSEATSDLVKKVTVEISYKFKQKINKVALSTIISNTN